MSLKKSSAKIKSKHSVSVKAKAVPARSESFKDLGDMDVVMDLRVSKDRRGSDRRQNDLPMGIERRDTGERRAKVNRRRQIDPTTCERDYSSDELEFMNALDDYKRRNGRMFPTCSEILEVLRGIGYAKSNAGIDEMQAGIAQALVGGETTLEIAEMSV
jgi:hypothetical protein